MKRDPRQSVEDADAVFQLVRDAVEIRRQIEGRRKDIEQLEKLFWKTLAKVLTHVPVE